MCVPLSNNCTETQFVCSNGRCVWLNRKCDSQDDCGDGSDENPVLCAEHTCPPSAFVCRNGRCVNARYRCDHDDDCRDGSDEEECAFPTCGPDQFECKNFRCIDARQVQWFQFDCSVICGVSKFVLLYCLVLYQHIYITVFQCTPIRGASNARDPGKTDEFLLLMYECLIKHKLI